jgi:parallel beta-helix repeat protein
MDLRVSKIGKISCIFIAILMLITIPVSASRSNEPGRSMHVEHSSITIIGDLELAAMALTESWPGSGSAVDPYMISGYNINGTGSVHGIHLKNTRSHVQFYNIMINETPDGNGILLENADNVAVIECWIRDSGNSSNIHIEGCNSTYIVGNRLEGNLSSQNILLKDSNDTVILSNEVLWSNGNGVFVDGSSLEGSNNIEIIENLISDINMTGIFLEQSTQVLLQGNQIQRCNDLGISSDLISSTFKMFNNTLIGNDIEIQPIHHLTLPPNNTIDGSPIRFYDNVDLTGIIVPHDTSKFILHDVVGFTLLGMDYSSEYKFLHAYDSNDITLDGCSIEGAEEGLFFYRCDDVSINNTSIRNLTGRSLGVNRGSGLSITNCSFERNGELMWLYYPSGLSINNNNFVIGDDPIDIFNVEDLIFRNNRLEGIPGSEMGFYGDFLYRSNISSNDFYGFNSKAISISHFDRSLFSNNFFYGSGIESDGTALDLEYSDMSTIEDNHIEYCYNGITLRGDVNYANIRSNLIENNLGDGISIHDGSNYNIHGNLLFNNSGYGVNITDSTDCKVN